MRIALFYILSVVFVNYAFEAAPLLPLPGGELWPPMSLLVGFVFVIRDYAQREIGHWVLFAMLIGGALSWLLATPAIALASVCAFLFSEMTDWAVYTFTGRPFSQRILLSSALSTPVDSMVFLSMTGLFSLPTLLIMTLSKMVGAFIVYCLVRRREKLCRSQCCS
ncbi:VUT family protein [Desulfovibrio sp. OttesenSCG-928-M14]|nr:VUT family protein [Desulfovibrio sp. OttesenSCG-928-M14]